MSDFEILFSADPPFQEPGFGSVMSRTSHKWFWYGDIDGDGDNEYRAGEVDWNVVHRNLGNPPLREDLLNVLDLELVGPGGRRPSRFNELQQLKEGIRIHKAAYPNCKIGPYRLIPFLNVVAGQRYLRVLGKPLDRNYETYTRNWQSVIDDNDSDLVREVASMCDFLTIRGYLPKREYQWQYFEFMQMYIDMARRNDKPLYLYLTPSYTSVKPWQAVPVDFWTRILHAARDQWRLDGVIIWINDSSPVDVEANSAWRQATRSFAGLPAIAE